MQLSCHHRRLQQQSALRSRHLTGAMLRDSARQRESAQQSATNVALLLNQATRDNSPHLALRATSVPLYRQPLPQGDVAVGLYNSTLLNQRRLLAHRSQHKYTTTR
jgi:hypothetical protein